MSTGGDTTSSQINRKAAIAWTLTVLWMIVIFLFSAQPYSGHVTEKYFGLMNIPVRKLAHLTEYGILFSLWRWSLRSSFGERYPSSVWALVASILYAISDEFHQAFVPGRSATAGDAIFDATGALIAWGLWVVIGKFNRRDDAVHRPSD